MEASCSSEIMITIYTTIWYHSPEVHNLDMILKVNNIDEMCILTLGYDSPYKESG
jgi:hypothetical protein